MINSGSFSLPSEEEYIVVVLFGAVSTISLVAAFVIADIHFVLLYALLIIQLRCKLVYFAFYLPRYLRILNANHLFCIEMINYHITDWNIETLQTMHACAQSLRPLRVSSRTFAISFAPDFI